MKESIDPTPPAADFKTAFAALVDEMKDEAHPTDDELVLYHEGGLPPERRSAVEEHLLTCRECFTLVQDLRSFAEAEGGEPEAPADFETAAFYRMLQPRLGEMEGQSRWKASSWNFPRALAATFAVTALGLSFWAASQQRTITAQAEKIAQLSDIQANVEIHDLHPGQRDGRAEEPEILSGLLVLTPEFPPQATAYEIRILDAEGSVLRTVPDLQADPRDGTFTLWLPPGALPPGRYQVVLYAEGESIAIGRYWMNVPTTAP